MFQSFKALKDYPHNPNPFEQLFLPQLNPYKLFLLTTGFVTSLLVHIKLRQKFRSSSSTAKKDSSSSSLTMKNFMDRIVLSVSGVIVGKVVVVVVLCDSDSCNGSSDGVVGGRWRQ